MAVSDAVVGNLTAVYVAVIAVIKAYGLLTDRTFTGVFVVVLSTVLVGGILLITLMWDISLKATCSSAPDHRHVDHICRGGICWHGVAVKSPASEIWFRVPQYQADYNRM